MVSDSSKPKDKDVETLLYDNHLHFVSQHNVQDGKVYAFPYLDTLVELNARINKLEERLALQGSE